MLAQLSFRAKMLIAAAVACLGYVIWMPDSGETVEPAKAGDGAVAAHSHANSGASAMSAANGATAANSAAARNGKAADPSPLKHAFYALAHRVVKDAPAASLFGAHSWFVAPPAPPPAPVVVQAPPPPQAPPLPFAYMGTYKADGTPTYFLTAGDRVYDVKVGDKLNNTYSIDDVKGGQMILTYMPLKIQQTLSVGEE